MKVDELYLDMQRTTGAANTRSFEDAFLAALKSVIVDLNRILLTEISAPEDVNGSDIGFPEYVDNVYHTGVKYYLQRMGEWSQEPDAQAFQFYQQQLRSCIGPAIAEQEDFPTR